MFFAAGLGGGGVGRVVGGLDSVVHEGKKGINAGEGGPGILKSEPSVKVGAVSKLSDKKGKVRGTCMHRTDVVGVRRWCGRCFGGLQDVTATNSVGITEIVNAVITSIQ